MKNRYANLLKWIMGGCVIVVLLMIPEFLIARKITQNESDFTTKCYAIMFIFVTVLIYIIIVYAKLIQFEKYRKLYNINKKAKAVNELTSEFKPVILKNSGDVSTEKFECQAKVDENGKIICKIYVDFETKLDSYEEFLKYFHLNEE